MDLGTNFDNEITDVLNSYLNSGLDPARVISGLLRLSYGISEAYGEDYLMYLMGAVLSSNQSLMRAKKAIDYYINAGFDTPTTLH